MLKTVICDDELPALELLCGLLKKTGAVDIRAAVQDVAEAITFVNEGDVDLVVLDIDMPDITGVEAFRSITLDPKPLLIFATAHPEYALEAFDVDAIDYLLKPLDPERVAKAIEKAKRLHGFIQQVADDTPEAENAATDALRVKDGNRVYMVPLDQVVWIEAAGDYSLVHTGEREYAMRQTISGLERELPADQFVRVHRSTIISSASVKEVHALSKGEARIVLKSGAEVKASRSYRNVVRQLTSPT